MRAEGRTKASPADARRHGESAEKHFGEGEVTKRGMMALIMRTAVLWILLCSGSLGYAQNVPRIDGVVLDDTTDAPVLADLIRRNPDVRDTAIVAFADRRTGVGLYAFVEADESTLETQLRSELNAAKGPKPPEHIQVVQALPRNADGKPRTEILQLVAMNQLDLIEPLMASETDRAFLKDILEQRKNLRDRFNFEAADLKLPSS